MSLMTFILISCFSAGIGDDF